MKYKIFAMIAVLALVFAAVGTTPAKAAAYGTSFVTSITYQNVGTATASITIDFYAEASGTPISITRPELAVNAGSSVYVGSISSISSGFKGSAVMSSSQPLVATLVQAAPSTSAVKVRPLSNGFSGGAATVLVPTVLKKTFGYTSTVSIQNVDSVGADLTVEFIPTSGTGFSVTVTNLPSGAAKYYDMGTFTNAGLGATFSGSMRVTAVQTGTSTPGAVIATSLEAGTSSNLAYAFEGAIETGTSLYYPSAFCKYQATVYTSTYAVQNVGTAPIDITVTYDNTNTETFSNVAGGAKVSIPGCGSTGTLNPAGYMGSAKVTGTGQIVGMAKISNNQGLLTAFLGFTGGSNKIAAPFVRWTQAHWTDKTRSRGVLAIQNIGDTTLAAGDVVVKYYDKNGTLVATHSMPEIIAGGKTNSNPQAAGAGDEFGYYSDGSTGGAAVVEGPVGSKLAVIVRISTSTGSTTLVGEDYNGFPIQ